LIRHYQNDTRGIIHVPSGENQWTQLLRAERRRGKGSLVKLQRRLWFALDVAEGGLTDAMQAGGSADVKRWLHVFNQLAGTYAKVSIDGDLEQRLKALEDAVS
jgi:hypothetical protein